MTSDLTTIEIPSFDFSGFYYPQLLEALIAFKRLHVPELTDESPQEPLIQLLRAFALVGHLNNTLLDQVANESTLPTAQLVETVRNMLRLIGYEMRSASPAQADLIYELSQVISIAVEAIPDFAQAGTVSGFNSPTRYFEAITGQVVDPTDELTKCFAVEDNGGGQIFTDRTTEANGVGTFTPWATPLGGSALREGDFLLFGHAHVMWNQADFALISPASGITGVWEYYDGSPLKRAPSLVTDNGPFLTLNLTEYLGTTNLSGTPIRIYLNSTGAFEDRYSYYQSGQNKVDTTGLLGQAVPSTTPSDYTIGSVWERFVDLADATLALTVSDAVKYTLPQTLTANWSLGTFQGQEAFWMRFRITTVTAPVSPVIDSIEIHNGKQYLKRTVTQGRLQDEVIGSSDGSPSQILVTSKTNFITASDQVFVDNAQWTRVDDFLASRPTDRHYRVQLGEDDVASVYFGDGVAGAIPTVGVNNLRAVYRYGAQDDGNVGAQTITTDKTGLNLVNKIFNPRPAFGWSEAEGASEASLARAKIAGPASLRTREIALGPDDCETLVVRANSIDAEVVKVSRAKAIEEGFGPKTIELVVVAAGGGQASPAALADLSEFFNGNEFVTPTKEKRLVANQEVTAVNFVPRVINITATIKRTGNVNTTQIQNALIRLIQPETLRDDGITYEWDFGGRVPISRLTHEIFKVDEKNIKDVDITVPAIDVELLPRELPVVGTLTLTLVS